MSDTNRIEVDWSRLLNTVGASGLDSVSPDVLGSLMDDMEAERQQRLVEISQRREKRREWDIMRRSRVNALSDLRAQESVKLAEEQAARKERLEQEFKRRLRLRDQEKARKLLEMQIVIENQPSTALTVSSPPRTVHVAVSHTPTSSIPDSLSESEVEQLRSLLESIPSSTNRNTHTRSPKNSHQVSGHLRTASAVYTGVKKTVSWCP
jgi:hypothetical protein